MNREALIGTLQTALMRDGADWEDDAMACADVVVDFFAAWIIQKSKEDSHQYPWRLYEQWCKEMGA